jgi:tetratricopeptide (TPR) repeat protein
MQPPRLQASLMYLALASAAFCADTPGGAELNRQGAALQATGRFAEAEQKYRAALAACESCADLPAILNNLGSLYYSRGDQRDAEPLLARAIDLWTKRGEETAALAIAEHNLAAVYRIEGRFADAVRLYEQALKLRTALPGASDLELVPMLNSLALLYQETADYSRVHESLDRALAIIKSEGAEDSAEAGATFTTLGVVGEREGKMDAARTWLERALAIRERLYDEHSLLLAETLNALAAAYRYSGQGAKAEALARRASSIYETHAGMREDPLMLAELGRLQADRGDIKQAERLFREAIHQLEKQPVQNRPEMAAILSSLGSLMFARGRYSDAGRLWQRAFEMDRAIFSSNHPRIAYDLENIAVMLSERKEYAVAEMLLLEARTILGKALPIDHPELGKVRASMAELLGREGRLEESRNLFREAIRILQWSWGPQHPGLLPILTSYAHVLRSLEDYADAASVDAQAMRIRVARDRRDVESNP